MRGVILGWYTLTMYVLQHNRSYRRWSLTEMLIVYIDLYIAMKAVGELT